MENLSSQKQKVTHNCHGKIDFETTNSNYSRQITKHSRHKQKQLLQFKIQHGKSKTLTARAKLSLQKQNTHGKSRTLTGKANTHGKSKHSRQYQLDQEWWSSVDQVRGIAL